MTEAVKQFRSQLGALSQQERAELAYWLLTSLEPADDGVEDAWRAELHRRIAEIRSGRAVGRDADELFAELREQYP
jgi:putative addiction module component (TIGR02574 family)